MTALARIGQLGQEVAIVTSIEEAKALCDKAEALRVYWSRAKDREPEIRAAEVRIRAERKLGELMIEYREAGLIRPGKPKSDGTDADRITLVAAGIDERLGDRARKYAALPVDEFEARITARRASIERGDKRVSTFIFDPADKAAARAAREVDLATKVRALPERCYGVILADPEWRFEPYSRETGMDRSADNHYPTSPTEAIAARDVRRIAADHCALFLWATVPMLPQALDVMTAWGFAYKSHWVWIKDRLGTGYWNRNAHELLLLGTRGQVPAPVPGGQWPSWLHAPPTSHSAKPERFLEMIEAYFPSLPKIELNRRGPARPGWDAWGNEAEAA